MIALANALASCPDLEELRFSGNSVGATGMEAVAAQLPRWPKLRELHAQRNRANLVAHNQPTGIYDPIDLWTYRDVDLQGQALGRALVEALPSLPRGQFFLDEATVSKGLAEELRATNARVGNGVYLWPDM